MGFGLIGDERFGAHFYLVSRNIQSGWLLMRTQYEIFRNARHGDAVKITTVETLGQAEQTLYALA